MPRDRADEAEAEEKRRQLGIPDWRCPDAYPRPSELSESGWRWEFLRRCPTYRADFAKEELEFGRITKARHFENVYMLGDPQDPRLSAKQIETGENIDTAERGKAEEAQKDDVAEIDFKWPGIALEQIFVDTRAQTWYSSPLEVDRILTFARHLDIILRADPLRPIEPQLRAFRCLLADSQRSHNKGRLISRRSHVAKWPVYLRVLDARDVGATYAKIAEFLKLGRGSEQAARDVLRQAERLRDNWGAETQFRSIRISGLT